MELTTQTLYPDARPLTTRAWRNDVYEALNDAGMEKVAERWLSCSDNFKTRLKPSPDTKLPSHAEKVAVCSADHTHECEIYSQSCDLRICPDCARMHSARLVARYLPKCEELLHQHSRVYHFRHIVFTTPHSLEDTDIRKKLICGFRQVEKAMNALMSEDGAWKHEQGYLVSAEFGEEGRKLHYHVFHYGRYLAHPDLVKQWTKATCGVASVVFVRGLHRKGKTIEDSIREVLKYATKFYSKDEVTGEIFYIPAKLMPLLAKTIEGTRRVRTAGVFYNVPEPIRDNHSCQTCGAVMIGIPLNYFETYCNTGFLPLDWLHARTGDGLNLRTADKSHLLSSSLDPPYSQKEVWKQKDFAFLKNIRRQDYD